MPQKEYITKLKASGRQLIITARNNWLYVFMSITISGSFFLLWCLNKLEIFPATLFSVIAVFFSYHAYKFSKEKFRLDLLDRRLEIYKELVDFCSIVSVHATLTANDDNRDDIIKARQAAHASFRGMGYHKIHVLFGEDIHELCKKLSMSYSHVTALDVAPSDQQERARWAQERMEHIGFISDTTGQLPILFRPYRTSGSTGTGISGRDFIGNDPCID